MQDSTDPKIRVAAPPDPDQLSFDLERALASLLSVRTIVPEDAMTASLLGTERSGHGVLIDDDGLVVTIGYLVTEAEAVWLLDNAGRTVPGHVVAYDQETGFGLVQTLQRLDLPPLEIGRSADLVPGDEVIVAGHGGLRQAVAAEVISKREFAGYWEYVLDEAIFTAPAHTNWGGTAVIADDGTLRGIGSLLVQQVVREDVTLDANMVVPIDLLDPIREELLRYGRRQRPPRPWLGMMTTEYEGHLVVAGVIDKGPASAAGIEVGDVIVEVNGNPVSELATLFRAVWNLGPAGVAIPLTCYRNEQMHEIVIQSADRGALLKAHRLH